MKVIETSLPGVLVIEPKVFGDTRGFFFESYNEKEFRKHAGINACFVQDNHSSSMQNVLRGLHYQIQHPQGKLVRVTVGAVYDVAVDLRKSSPMFGHWTSIELSSENKRIAWIPPGFAHGFLVLSERAEFLYKATDFYAPAYERSLLWNDPDIGIDWPLQGSPLLAPKDAQAKRLAEAEVYS